jgi:hypothetical protein
MTGRRADCAQWRRKHLQVVAEQKNIRAQAGETFVYILKRFHIGQHHHEKSMIEGAGMVPTFRSGSRKQSFSTWCMAGG